MVLNVGLSQKCKNKILFWMMNDESHDEFPSFFPVSVWVNSPSMKINITLQKT